MPYRLYSWPLWTKITMCQKSGVIYHYKCSHMDCPEQYIGESGRTFGDRFREHLMVPLLIHQHSQSKGHHVDLECFTIIDRGPSEQLRKPLHLCEWPFPQQKPGELQPSPPVGWGTTEHPFAAAQITTPALSLPPTMGASPSHIPYHMWGAQ